MHDSHHRQPQPVARQQSLGYPQQQHMPQQQAVQMNPYYAAPGPGFPMFSPIIQPMMNPMMNWQQYSGYGGYGMPQQQAMMNQQNIDTSNYDGDAVGNKTMNSARNRKQWDDSIEKFFFYAEPSCL